MSSYDRPQSAAEKRALVKQARGRKLNARQEAALAARKERISNKEIAEQQRKKAKDAAESKLHRPGRRLLPGKDLDEKVVQSEEHGKATSKLVENQAATLDQLTEDLAELMSELDEQAITDPDWARGRFQVPATSFHMDTAAVVLDLALSFGQDVVVSESTVPTTLTEWFGGLSAPAEKSVEYKTIRVDATSDANSEGYVIPEADVDSITVYWLVKGAEDDTVAMSHFEGVYGFNATTVAVTKLPASGGNVTITEAALAAALGLTVGAVTTGHVQLKGCIVSRKHRGAIISALNMARVGQAFASLKAAEMGAGWFLGYQALLSKGVSAVLGSTSAFFTNPK